MSLWSRRALIASAGAAALVARAGAQEAPPPISPFVRRSGTGFTLGGKPYRYVGANLWYGAWLGSPGLGGDRARLGRELDRLAALGVTNLRVLASGEASPLKGAMRPSFHGKGHTANGNLIAGLDWLLVELGKRQMRAVLYLTNFWEWSGGMMTYLSYVNGGHYIDMGDPAHPWPEFPNATAEFYQTPAAIMLYRDWVRGLVSRTNGISGIKYADDPAIMAWQLANEPRPGGDVETAERIAPAFFSWAMGTARLIRALDPHHLICTGSEGLKGTAESPEIYMTLHGMREFDYLTAHIWPQNWGWIDPNDLGRTGSTGMTLASAYIARHVDFATQLRKPLVIEEFGWPRDDGGYDPAGKTTSRDGYYRMIYDAVEASVARGGPLVGSNFWAWSGEGRAARDDRRWQAGDPLLGDPPHEPQGWYGVFDGDASTLALIEGHAKALARA